MPLLTCQEYREFVSLYGESRHLFEVGQLRESFRRTVWVQRALHERDATWEEQTPASLVALDDTWIMTLVREVSQQDNCHEWLEERESHDNFTHPLKTPERMAEIDEVSGYARIMLSSTSCILSGKLYRRLQSCKVYNTIVFLKKRRMSCVVLSQNGQRIIQQKLNSGTIDEEDIQAT